MKDESGRLAYFFYLLFLCETIFDSNLNLIRCTFFSVAICMQTKLCNNVVFVQSNKIIIVR